MTAAKGTAREAARETAKEAVNAKIGAWRARLLELSHAIHADPEPAFEERRAAGRVAQTLRAAGFDVEVGVHGLETSVEAVYGSGDLTVALCAEYDALPGLGHACGHNIIAAAGVGAAIGLAAVADELGVRVKLLGTPAEESGAGKTVMLEAGAWEDATISLMVHGAPGPDVSCTNLTSQAIDRFEVTYRGEAAHAALPQDSSSNAAHAATVAQVALGLLRQHLPAGVRFNAYVEHGGDATNVIPGRTEMRAEIRSLDFREVRRAKDRLLACFEAGAVATGCDWEWGNTEPPYANVAQEPVLAAAWDDNMRALGRDPVSTVPGPAGSTDMGNVSQVVPAIHPVIALDGVTAMPHTAEFAAQAVTEAADQAAIDGALALAGTVVDIALDPGHRADLLRRQKERGPGSTLSPVAP